MPKTSMRNPKVHFFTTAFISLIVALSFSSLNTLTHPSSNLSLPILQKIFAEDDEEEEDGREESDEDYYESSTNTEPAAITNSTAPVPPQVVRKLVPAGLYALDTDKDGLVDAIDPDPNIPQQNYFTDSDGDGVSDTLDKYPGENDYSFIEGSDQNNNGIWDSLEY